MPYYAKSLPACCSWGRRAPSSALARSRSFKAGRSGGFSEHFLFGGRAWFTYSIPWRLLGLGYRIRGYIKENNLGMGSHVQLGLGCSDGTYLEGTSRSCMWPRALACGGGTALVSAGAGGTVRGGSCGYFGADLGSRCAGGLLRWYCICRDGIKRRSCSRSWLRRRFVICRTTASIVFLKSVKHVTENSNPEQQLAVKGHGETTVGTHVSWALQDHLSYLPVVPHKAVAEVSEMENL